MFVKNKEAQEDGKGSKWSLTALKAYYESVGIDSTAVRLLIYLVILKDQRRDNKDVYLSWTHHARYPF